MTIYLTRMIRGVMIWCVVLLVAFSVSAQPTPAPSTTLVNDWAEVFSASQRNALESKLVNFNNTNSTQIVVITQSGIDRELNEYSTDIIEKWGIGQKGLSNGVLLLIDPTKHNTYIATGSGAEGWLPDILAKRIIDNNLLPAFKEGNYYDGTNEATDMIMKLATGEYTEADVKSPKGSKQDIRKWTQFLPFLLILLFFFFRGRGGRGGSGGWMMTGGGFGGYSGGGGFGGGGGGGGFGGFGGGGSSGGGAGGSW